MTAGAANWIWLNSRAANGALIVLLAIADECGEEEETEMSITDLARKARLSDRAARMAVKDLADLGELSVTVRPGGVSRYAPCPTPAISAGPPRQYLPDHPGNICRTPQPECRQNLPGHPEEPQTSATSAISAGPESSDESSGTGRSVVGKPSPAKPAKQETPRPDVDRLCTRLADRIEANGSRRPNITQRWKDAARRMLDIDGRTEEQVMRAIDWCQKDEFWSANILSMPKLRDKYDQLRLRAIREQRQKASGRQNPDDDYAAALKRIQERKEETANGTRGDSDDRAPRQISLPPAAG